VASKEEVGHLGDRDDDDEVGAVESGLTDARSPKRSAWGGPSSNRAFVDRLP
jgi:hypothetical protein